MKPADSLATGSISSQAVLVEMEKICSSATLGSSIRLCRFLRYIVEQTLAGRGGELKEYAIGVEVFDRPASYDPNIDSVVRSGARRLRSKLKDYFESEGVRDPMLVNLRAGSYVPLFRPRESLSVDLKANLATKPETPAGDVSALLVAVLPFAALGDDPDAEEFAEGLTEEVTHRLSQISGLSIVARRSASQFKSSDSDLSTIHEQLGADLVLEGTVRKTGSHLRISSELDYTSNGHQLWSGQVRCEMTDVFKVQDEIASAIVTAIRPRTSHFRKFALNPQPIVLAAYSLYLRGRGLWNENTPSSLRAAIGCFEEAIRTSPTYAPAHAGLADCHLALTHHSAEAPKDLIPPAKAAALRAIELDDELAEAITSLANIRLIYDWDWQGAESLFQRAIQLGADSTAHLHYSVLLEAGSRFDECLDHLERAARLDPLAAQPRVALGLAFYRHGKCELALKQLGQALKLSGSEADVHCALSLIYMQLQRFDEAIRCIHKARTLAGANPGLVSASGAIYALGGREAEAQQALNELTRLARTTYVSPVDRALLYVAFGERNAALDQLEQGYDGRASGMIWLNVDPRFDALRGNARFIQLIEKMEFPRNTGLV